MTNLYFCNRGISSQKRVLVRWATEENLFLLLNEELDAKMKKKMRKFILLPKKNNKCQIEVVYIFIVLKMFFTTCFF